MPGNILEDPSERKAYIITGPTSGIGYLRSHETRGYATPDEVYFGALADALSARP